MRAQLVHGRPEAGGVLFGGETRHLEGLGDAREPLGVGDHGGGVGDRRHQPLLVIDQHELAVLGV